VNLVGALEWSKWKIPKSFQKRQEEQKQILTKREFSHKTNFWQNRFSFFSVTKNHTTVYALNLHRVFLLEQFFSYCNSYYYCHLKFEFGRN